MKFTSSTGLSHLRYHYGIYVFTPWISLSHDIPSTEVWEGSKESDIQVWCLKFNNKEWLLFLKWGLILTPQTLTALHKTCLFQFELFSVPT